MSKSIFLLQECPCTQISCCHEHNSSFRVELVELLELGLQSKTKTDRQTEIDRLRQTEIDRLKQTDRLESDKQTEIHRNTQTYRQTETLKLRRID